jgi:hypothetical protein
MAILKNGERRLIYRKMASMSSEKLTDDHVAKSGFQATPPAQPPAQQIKVDDSNAQTRYTNFCRVTGTPEELIIDFGLNSQPVGNVTEPIVITQRIVTNFYTAKRLLSALAMSVQRHEAAFGVLETDIQKRVMPGARRGG